MNTGGGLADDGENACMSSGALRLGKKKERAPPPRPMNDARQANAVCARRQTNTRHLRCAEPGPISLSAEETRPEPRGRATVTRSGSSRRSPCRRQRLAWVSLSWAKRAGRGPAPRPPRSVPARPICLSRRRGAAVPGPGDASLSRCDRREDCETGRAHLAVAHTLWRA